MNKLENMGIHLCLVISILFGCVYGFPQNTAVKPPHLDFSSAQEVNNLEPSVIPGIESRSFSSASNGNYVEATVEEVQNILKTNPDLPRLTRGEIIDLLENITREDMEKLRTLNNNRNGKAILLVMPYSPKRNGETMEDLYTKRPVTQLIDTDNSSSEEKHETKRRKKPLPTTKNVSFRRGSIKATSTSSTTPSNEITQPLTTITVPVSTTQKSTTHRSRTRPPRTRPPTTSRPPSTTRPYRRRRITTASPTTVTRFQNHRYSDENTDKFLPENAIRPSRPSLYRVSRRTTTHTPDLIVAESFVNNVYLKYDPTQDKTTGNIENQDNIHPYFREDTDEEVTTNVAFKPIPSQPQEQHDNSLRQESVTINNEFIEVNSNKLFKPLKEKIFINDKYIDSKQDKSTLKSPPEDYIIPEDLKYVIEDLELESTLKKDSVLEDAIKSATIFPRTTASTTTTSPITPMPEFKEVADNLSPEMKTLLMTFGLIPNDEVKGRRKELKDGYYPEKAEENPESYTGFKPLPEEGEPDKDMDALLASFGLGRSARKGRKFKKEVKKEQVMDFSMIPDSMLEVVENLGLIQSPVVEEKLKKNDLPGPVQVTQRTGRISRSHELNKNEAAIRNNVFSNEIENDSSNTEEKDKNDNKLIDQDANDAKAIEHNYHDTNLEEPGKSEFLVFAESEMNTTESNLMTEDTQTTKDKLTSVVFNPTGQKIVEQEKEQLDKLMELVKALKAINGSATEEDFQNIDLDTLKHFTEVLNNSQRLTLGEQISMSENEPKMHSTSTEIVTIVVPSETQNEIESESQVLEASPGGFQVEEMESESPESKKLQSGPYYLIDWNSFLEVDDTKGRRVNLRFQPTVGDPTRFYSINNN